MNKNLIHLNINYIQELIELEEDFLTIPDLDENEVLTHKSRLSELREISYDLNQEIK